MGRPNHRRNSNGNDNNNKSTVATSTSASGSTSPSTRTGKRKSGESPDDDEPGKKTKVANGAPFLPPPPPPPQEEEEEEILEESQQDKEKRQRAIELLREADDLPSAYASLKLVKHIIGGGDSGSVIARRIARLFSPADQVLIDQASLAVPYLMYKLCVEEFTQPRAQGGLAYSHAKAVEMASILFEKAGPACCCAANMITELQLVKKCNSSTSSGGKDKKDNNSTVILTKNDARKVLPILNKIGINARSKVDEIFAKLEAPPPEAKVASDEGALSKEQEAPQSSETKVTSTNEEALQQQEVAPQAQEETKAAAAAAASADDDEAPQSYDL